MISEILPEDKIITKDSRTIRVLSVRKNGDQIFRVEGIDDSAVSPMRTSIQPSDILRVLPNQNSSLRKSKGVVK